MADRLTVAQRSALIAKVRARGNATTELALARVLRAEGLIGWRRQRLLTGRGGAWKVRPDFIFPRRRWAVFVDGCFWHGCPRHGTRPKGRAAFRPALLRKLRRFTSAPANKKPGQSAGLSGRNRGAAQRAR